MEENVRIKSEEESDLDVVGTEELLRDCLTVSSLAKLSKKRKTNKKFSDETRCKQCGKILCDKESLKRHLILHTGARDHACPHCPKRFATKKYRRTHVRAVHLRLRPFPCDVCGKKFRTDEQLKYHRYTHTGERPFKCKVCGKTFNREHVLKTHSYIHTGEKPYACHLCRYACRDSSTLRKHVERHLNTHLKYECAVCKHKYDSKSKLRLHIAAKHARLDVRRLECDMCGSRFAVKGSLAQHMMNVHLRRSPRACHVCGRRFASAANMSGHLQRHVDQRDFNCETCGAAFKCRVDLKKHSYIHLPPRYVCKTCGRGFVRAHRLRRHERVVHQRRRAAVCELCPAAFYSQAYLSVHVSRVHADVALLRCDACGATARNKPGLIMHMRKHAPRVALQVPCKTCGKKFRGATAMKRHSAGVHGVRVARDYRVRARPKKPPVKTEPLDIEEHGVEPADGDSSCTLSTEQSVAAQLIRAAGGVRADERHYETFYSEKMKRKSGPLLKGEISEPEIKKRERIPREKVASVLQRSAPRERAVTTLPTRVNMKEWDSLLHLNEEASKDNYEVSSTAKRPMPQLSTPAGGGAVRNLRAASPRVYAERLDSAVLESYLMEMKRKARETLLGIEEEQKQKKINIKKKKKEKKPSKGGCAIKFRTVQCYTCFKSITVQVMGTRNRRACVNNIMTVEEAAVYKHHGKWKSVLLILLWDLGLFSSQAELMEHCRVHFASENAERITICPICSYEGRPGRKGLWRHVRLEHKVDLRVSGHVEKVGLNKYIIRLGKKNYKKKKSKKYDSVNEMSVEVIPTAKTINKMKSDEIDRRRKLNGKAQKSKLVNRGGEWVVETEEIPVKITNADGERLDVKLKDLIKNREKEDLTVDTYLMMMRTKGIEAKKRGQEILYPCDKCEKVCLAYCGFKLHRRVHNSKAKAFKARVKKFLPTESDEGNKMNDLAKKIERIENKKKERERIENRKAKAKPIADKKYKCDESLKTFFTDNITGKGVDFEHFLKAFRIVDKNFDSAIDSERVTTEKINAKEKINRQIIPNKKRNVAKAKKIIKAKRRRNFAKIRREMMKRRNELREKLRKKMAEEFRARIKAEPEQIQQIKSEREDHGDMNDSLFQEDMPVNVTEPDQEFNDILRLISQSDGICCINLSSRLELNAESDIGTIKVESVDAIC